MLSAPTARRVPTETGFKLRVALPSSQQLIPTEEQSGLLTHIAATAQEVIMIGRFKSVEAVPNRRCFNAPRPAFLPSSQGTWFRLENYGRMFRSSHLGQFPMLHRTNIT